MDRRYFPPTPIEDPTGYHSIEGLSLREYCIEGEGQLVKRAKATLISLCLRSITSESL